MVNDFDKKKDRRYTYKSIYTLIVFLILKQGLSFFNVPFLLIILQFQCNGLFQGRPGGSSFHSNGRIGNLQLKTDHTSNGDAIKYLLHLLDNKQLTPKFNSLVYIVREAAKKKCSSTNGQAIKALTPPPPLELNGHRNFFLFFLKSENSRKQILTTSFSSPQFLD